jgi:hypothetical protein
MIGIQGTPTMLLVGGQGKVQEEWFGFLEQTQDRYTPQRFYE